MLILKITLFLFDILQDEARRNALQRNILFFKIWGLLVYIGGCEVGVFTVCTHAERYFK